MQTSLNLKSNNLDYFVVGNSKILFVKNNAPLKRLCTLLYYILEQCYFKNIQINFFLLHNLLNHETIQTVPR